MSEMTVHVVRVRTPDGDKDYVTLAPPAVVFSKGLAAEAIVGQLLRPLEPGESITPDVFAKNPAFVELLHAVVARESPQQASCVAEAKNIWNGYLYVIDQRTATPEGAVPPEDIIGGFEVKDGAVIGRSYTPNPNHRILSARGFFRLDAHLHACLVQELETRNRNR
jgi:hypothetical protein